MLSEVEEKAVILQERRNFYGRIYQKIEDVCGDVVECGVARGTSFAILASLIAKEGKGRRLWGFDAWQSPEYPRTVNDPPDRTVPTYPFKPSLIFEKARREGAENVESFAHLVRGFVEDALPVWVAASPRCIAFVHLDVDLYSGHKVTLETLWPLMGKGGIVLLDEYHAVDIWPGAKKAVDEFLGHTPGDLVEDYRWYIRKP